MSLDKRSFSKIVVNDDEDFIIQAGAAPPSLTDKTHFAEDSVQLVINQDSSDAVEESKNDSEDQEPAFEREIPCESCSENEHAALTALEDELSVPPMSGMQKVIIVLAVLLLGAAIAYLVFSFAR